MSKKLGRNDPCHCGSGKKYKRCCIRKDREKPKAEAPLKKKKSLSNPFSLFSENLKGEIDLDPKRVRQNTPFSVCRRKFEESVEEEDLHEDHIFDPFISLQVNARDNDEHNYVIEKTYWMRSKEPEIFKSLSGYLIKHAITSAICSNRMDVLPELISWLDPAKHIDEFFRTLEMLFHYGDVDALETLKRVLTEEADRVKESSNIMDFGKDRYFIKLKDLMTAIEYSKTPPLDGKRLYEQLKPYISYHIQVGDVEEDIVSPMNKGREKAEEILTEIYRDDIDLLMPLKYSIASSLSKTHNISVTKSLLAADHLQDYLYSRIIEEDGESFARILLPDEESLNDYFINHMDILFPQFWTVASMMTILPYYTDLLQEVTIITPKRAEDFKEYLSSLLPGFLSALIGYSMREGVINTILAADLDRLYREDYLLKRG